MKYIKLFESFLDEDPIWIIVSHIEDHNIREIKIDNFPFKVYELGDNIPKKSEMDNLRAHMKESGFFFERNGKYIVVTDDEKIGQPFNMILWDLLIDYLIDNKIKIEERDREIKNDFIGRSKYYKIDFKNVEFLKYFEFSKNNLQLFFKKYLEKKYRSDFRCDNYIPLLGIYYYKTYL